MNYPARMKTSLCMLALLLLALPAASQDAPSSPTDPGALTRPATLPGPRADEETQARGQAMLENAARTFAQAPSLTCTTNVEIHAGDSVRTLVSESVFGPGGSMRVDTDNSLVVVQDGHLNVVVYSIPDRYLRVPVQLGVADEFEGHYRERTAAGWEILAREQDEWLDAITLRAIGQAMIVGLEEGLEHDGSRVNRVHLFGRLGAGHIDIDAESGLMTAVHVRLHPQPEFEGFVWTADLDIDIEIHETPPVPITFDPGPRSPAATPMDVDPVGRNIQTVGNEAPALVLPTLAGDVIDLAELKGNVVVLDFWATWCDPCKRSLPNLNALYTDRGRNEGEVKAFAVACWEKEVLADDRLASVRAYWQAAGYDVPTLVASDDAVRRAWGINNIPMIAVIGRDGTITTLIIGWKHDEVAQVAQAIKDALDPTRAEPVTTE